MRSLTAANRRQRTAAKRCGPGSGQCWNQDRKTFEDVRVVPTPPGPPVCCGREMLDRGTRERDRALWATAFYAGLRRGELMALEWGDVDLGNDSIRIERSSIATAT